MRRQVWRVVSALTVAMCVVGVSADVAGAEGRTFAPYPAGYAVDGSGSASSTYSTNEKGDLAFDAQASVTTLDPNATPATATAIVGGLEQITGNFPAGEYVGTTTLSHVFATATATGTGNAVARFGPAVVCSPCSEGDVTFPTIVSTSPIDGPFAPSHVSDATYTVEIHFTLESARTLIELGGFVDGEVSSYSSSTSANYGSGRAQLTGTIKHVSLHRVNA